MTTTKFITQFLSLTGTWFDTDKFDYIDDAVIRLNKLKNDLPKNKTRILKRMQTDSLYDEKSRLFTQLELE